MRKKIAALIIFASALAALAGCATVFRTNEAFVVAASRSTTAQVSLFANGTLIYEGALPVAFPVRSGVTYTVSYTTAEGESRTVTIAERFNWWFIGSLAAGFIPAIVDLATRSVVQVQSVTFLPISYSPPTMVLAEHVPEHPDLAVVGFFEYDD